MKPGAIRNMIRRLVDEQEIEKVRDGAYRLASQNGDSHAGTGLTENGAGGPLFTAPPPQEGT